VADFILAHPEISRKWHDQSNYIILLSVPTEYELQSTAQTLRAADLSISLFHEPDLDNELTAIAVEPSDRARRFCSRLKLAMKD